MKILGLFVVVFTGLLINRALGFSENAQIVGAIISASSFVLLVK